MPPIPYFLLLATALPLFSFLILFFAGSRLGKLAPPLATTLILGSFALSVAALVLWVAKSADKPESSLAHSVEILSLPWISLPRPPEARFSFLVPAPTPSPPPVIALGILVDSLTIALFILTTFIASLTHLFSIAAYPSHPLRRPGPARFFALLGLVCFATLALFLANSLIAILMFWLLLSLSTCLLIGMAHQYRASAAAALRSFSFQLIGDAAFFIGIGILALHTTSSNFALFDSEGASILSSLVRDALGVRSSEFLFFTSDIAHPAALHWLTWAGLFFFVAGAAKSAQFPLHLWLADAVEAPPPATALLLSASTVAAGIYLLARIFPILTMDARLTMAIFGCITLAAGALIALVQSDLRRILAWSAVCQLGYMFLFLGSGAYVWGLVHLFTTAFLMSALFFAASTVLHALQNDDRARNIRNLGGLWKKLPITAATSLLAALALAGTPALSSAYSRDNGLACVYDYAHALAMARVPNAHPTQTEMLLFWIPTFTTFLIALAMSRFWWLTFAGKIRLPRLLEPAAQPDGNAALTPPSPDMRSGEPPLMTLPLIVLSAFALGLLFEFFLLPKFIARSLSPAPAAAPSLSPQDGPLALVILYARLTFAAGVALAVCFYYSGLSFTDRLRRFPGIALAHVWLRENLFLDALYQGVLLNLLLAVSQLVAACDRLLNHLIRTLAAFTRFLARILKNLDRVLNYPFSLLIRPLARTPRVLKPPS